MNARIAVRKIMEENGIGTTILAKRTGVQKQAINNRLSTAKSANFTVEKMDELLRVMGYKIVLVPSDTEIEDGWYEVDSETGGTTTPPPVDGDEASYEELISKSRKKSKKALILTEEDG